MSEPRHRDSNCFDFLRLFAATCVLVTHAVEHLKAPFLWMRHGGSHNYWFFDGVALFFVMSGYLIYRSYERCVERKRPAWQYFFNRFLRIAPAIYAYAIVTTLLLLLIGVFTPRTLAGAEYWKWLAFNLALLPKSSDALFGQFGTGVSNGSLWTIPTEVSFYLAIPLIYQVQKRWNTRGMLLFVAALAVGGIVLAAVLANNAALGQFSFLLRLTFLPYMIFFGLGIFWSKYWERVPKHAWLAVACVLIYASIRTFNVFKVTTEPGQALFLEGSWSPLFCILWSVPLSYAALYVGHFGPQILRVLPQKIGDLSYGVYIWHMVVVNFFLHWGLQNTLSVVPGGAVLGVLIVSFVMASLSWRLIEKPAIQFKPYTSRAAVSVVESAPTQPSTVEADTAGAEPSGEEQRGENRANAPASVEVVR